MARRHRRRADPTRAPAAVGVSVVQRAGAEWCVRSVSGAASTRTYRCPGCQQQIRPATSHVVVWPVQPSMLAAAAGESGLAERRHWHTGCWARGR